MPTYLYFVNLPLSSIGIACHWIKKLNINIQRTHIQTLCKVYIIAKLLFCCHSLRYLKWLQVLCSCSIGRLNLRIFVEKVFSNLFSFYKCQVNVTIYKMISHSFLFSYLDAQQLQRSRFFELTVIVTIITVISVIQDFPGFQRFRLMSGKRW